MPDYLDARLIDLPEATPLALVSPYGPSHWIGPILLPGKTACYRCFANALIENNYLPPPIETSRARQSKTLHLMADWLQRWTGADCVREVYPTGKLGPRHRIRRRADCPVCGQGKLAASPLTSEVTGICSKVRVRRMGPLWLARTSQQLRHPDGPAAAVVGRREPVLGRGFSRHDAIQGCLAEAVERYSLYRTGHERIVRASYRDLAGEGLDPRRLLLFSERQYDERAIWNRMGASPFWVPPRFDELSPIDWVRAEPLSGGPARLVPADYCFYNGRPLFCVSNSNGCAAARTFEEAILSGLLELIERDAVAIWWYNRIARPAPAIAIDDLPELRGVTEFLRSRHRTIRTFDITPDLGIPVVAAATALLDGREILMGAACHPDPAVALRKAVSEAVQMLIAIDRNGQVDRADFPFAGEWFDTAWIDREPHLKASTEYAALLKAAPDLETCLAALRRAGLEGYYVDLTRAELGLRVVRVLVPELRFWVPRFAPGRLYDVPVKMGWLKRCRREEQLNKWPWFL